MENLESLLSLVLDSITEHIVVINDKGEIQYVNKSWSNFGSKNECDHVDDWHGVNYIDECDKASAMGDDFGTKAAIGIRSVINEGQPIFYLEYPCHSPNEQRWFMMRVTPLKTAKRDHFVISHQNITERKLAEENIKNLARIDGLTGIANRRTLDEFLQDEWRRCARLKKPISLAMVDLDHFKLLNDTYGHQYGDECLVKIGALLKRFVKRPSDICARYGGEEFVLIWGDSTLEHAKHQSELLLLEIQKLQINNCDSPVETFLTASIGLSSMFPSKATDEHELLIDADNKLYQAKDTGRNKIEF